MMRGQPDLLVDPIAHYDLRFLFHSEKFFAGEGSDFNRHVKRSRAGHADVHLIVGALEPLYGGLGFGWCCLCDSMA